MKNKYLSIFFLLFVLFILIFPTMIVTTQASSNTQDDEEDLIYGRRRGNLLDLILYKRFEWGITPFIGRYFNFQLAPPTPIQAYPGVIDVRYKNSTTIQIGGKDPRNPDQWQSLYNLIGTYNWGWIFNSVSFMFEVIPPEGIDENAITTHFDPKLISISPNNENLDWKGMDSVLRTNLTIEILYTDNVTYPTDDFVLNIKVIRQDVSSPWLLHAPPEYVRFVNWFKNIEKIDEMTFYRQWRLWYVFQYRTLTGWNLWLLNKRNNLPEVFTHVNNIVSVLVRVKKDHFADLIPPRPVKIYPDDILSIPVEVQNLGSHIDTYNFRVINPDDRIIVTPPSALTIEPGESRNAYVTVSTPSGLSDIGKSIELKLEAYSIEEPEIVFSNTISLTVEGIHLSMGFVYYVAIIGIILIILFSFFYIPIKRRRESICGKPDKPWLIEKEKEHLEKLIEKDKKKHDETLKMMREEYKSALLWHKYYTEAVIRENRNIRKEKEAQKKDEKLKMKAKIKEEKKEKKEKEKELKKQEEIEIKKREPEIKEEPKIPAKKEEEKIVLIDRKAELEKRKREITLFKIKRQQEKQRKKFGSST